MHTDHLLYTSLRHAAQQGTSKTTCRLAGCWRVQCPSKQLQTGPTNFDTTSQTIPAAKPNDCYCTLLIQSMHLSQRTPPHDAEPTAPRNPTTSSNSSWHSLSICTQRPSSSLCSQHSAHAAWWDQPIALRMHAILLLLQCLLT